MVKEIEIGQSATECRKAKAGKGSETTDFYAICVGVCGYNTY